MTTKRLFIVSLIRVPADILLGWALDANKVPLKALALGMLLALIGTFRGIAPLLTVKALPLQA